MNGVAQLLREIFGYMIAIPLIFEESHEEDYYLVGDKYENLIGSYWSNSKTLILDDEFSTDVLRKIKQIANVEEFSNEKVKIIAKELLDWCQNNCLNPVERVIMYNYDSGKSVGYPG